MERLRQTFQIGAAATIAVAAVMFAVAEGSPLPALTLPLVVFALLYIDRAGRPGMPAAAAVILAGVALLAALREFLVGGIEARLLAPAHFLTYLTWIVILQSKQSRQYWLLFGLSILQIAVAALLTSDAWFGLAVVLFAFLALWTLSSFTVYRAASRVVAAHEAGRPEADVPHHGPPTWRHERSSAWSMGQQGLETRIMGLRFAAGTLGTSVLSLMLAGLFFLYTPRIWMGPLRLFDNSALASGLRPLTGFSEEVTLGDMGEILSNDELVLELRLFDEDTGEAVAPEQYPEKLGGDDPLFRGMTHELYANGHWEQIAGLNYRRVNSESSETNLLRQTILLQPNGSPILFIAGDARACIPEEGLGDIEYYPTTRVYRRENEDADAAVFQYDVLTSPGSRGLPAGRSQAVDYWGSCLQLPATTERVVRHTQQIVLERFGSSPGTRTEVAEFLAGYLRNSGEFSYTLSLEVEDARIDPLEDFVFNRKRGHCEYFASALVIMLRAVGIHSRLVGGFKGGRYNPETDYFEVRQLHAHSWVEAYLEDAWSPLDPTPPSRESSVADLEGDASGGIRRWHRAWTSVWESGVRLTKGEQDRLLYQPLRETAAEAWAALHDVRGSSARLGAYFRSLVESPERWFSWRGGVTAFVLLAVLIVLTRLLRRVTVILKKRRGESDRAGDARPSVPFFDRFVGIVRQAGLERRNVETQLEFAELTESRLTAALSLPATAHLPEDVARKFYEVRFGQQPISAADAALLNERLDVLEGAMRHVSSGQRNE